MRLVDVRKAYRSGPAVLAGVDLELEPGTRLVLTGPNGSGKSTLLRIVAGCDSPSSGTVLDRPDVVGYLPDRFPALLRLPARRYLHHLAAVHGADPDDAEQIAEALLEEFGFTGEDDEPMSELSKGNAQKVGLTQALSCGAGLLVLDEPWSGLDDDAADALSDRLSASDVRLLVTDHTGEAERLPGVREIRLGSDGRLESRPPTAAPAAASPRSAAVRIELTCDDDPRRVLDRLPRALAAEVAPGRMTVHIAPPRSDAWLAAAIAAGCSVRSVLRV